MNKKPVVSVVIILAVFVVILFAIKSPISRSINEKGLNSYHANEYQLAEKYFRKALLWKRTSSVAMINLIKSQLAQEKTTDARKVLEKLKKIIPPQAETFGLEGQLLVMEDQFEASISFLNQAIERDSLLSYAYYYRGIARANLNDLDGAAGDYLTAQKLDQANIDALKKGAIVLSKLENFEAAIESYNKLLELDPSNTDAFLNRGSFKMKIFDYPGAIDDFTSAISLDDKQAEAYFNRGKSYANAEAYEKAITDFNKAAQLNYNIAGSNYNSGLASLRLNQPQEAKKYLSKALKSDTESKHSGNAYHLLGVMEMMQNKNGDAIDYFDKAIEIDPTYADAFYNRGIAYGLLQKPQKALNDLNKCLELGKNSSDVYFAMGVQKINLNDFASGCKDLRTAADMGNKQASDMSKRYCKQH